MVLLFEPVSLGEFFLIFFLILLVAGAALPFVVYFGLKYFAKFVNTKRDSWEDTAAQLGLEVQREHNELIKPLKGLYQNYPVRVSRESVSRGELSYDIYTVCEAYLPTVLPFSLEIKSEDVIKQALASMFRNKEVKIGIPGFDRSFYVDCPDDEAIRRLLSVDLPDGRTPNLLADLLLIKKSADQLKITDELVYIKKEGEFFDAADIRPIIDAAVYLAKRIEAARASEA